MRRRRRNHRRGKNKNVRNIVLCSFAMLFLLATGYSAFQTVISINAKGNIKTRTDYYVSSNGSDISGNGTLNNPYATIGKAYDSISSNVESTIHIMTDIVQTETITMSENKDITLISYGNNVNSIIRDSLLTDSIINISNGKLELKNIIIEGNNIETDNPMIKISSEATIEAGAILRNAKNNKDTGGALCINHGTVTMNDGQISNNQTLHGGGAGVFLPSNSESLFILNGGNIINNNAVGHGGAIMVGTNSTLNIKGGIISNNNATATGGGIYAHNNSSIIMSGGTICQNESGTSGGGIRLQSNAIMTMTGGTIKNNISTIGGGIQVTTNGTFTYNSGVICENSPTSNYETHTTCPS